MMQAIAKSGAAMCGASAVHMNIFGLQPVVVFGTDEQKRRMLPPLIAGKDKACFAVTEPDAGLDTTAIKVRAERRGDHYVLSGQKIWISTAQVANKILILARTTPLDRGQAQDRRAEPVLHRSRPQPSRGSRHREDGPPCRRLERDVLRRHGRPCRRSHRRRGRGLSLDPARHESGADPDRRGGGRHRPRGVAASRQVCARARGLSPPDRPEPGHRASAGAVLDGAGSGQPDGDEGGEPLRPRPRMRRRGQCRQVSRRPRRRSAPARPRS